MNGNKSSILVTGGLGNLGSWITDHLINSGQFDVTVLSKSKRIVGQAEKYQYLNCDLSKYREVQEVLGNKAFDYVVHLASINEGFVPDYASLALSINALGTRNLLEVLKENPPKKFLYFSTFHVYGKGSGIITENTPVHPKNDYAITHYFGEEYVKMYHANNQIPFIIFRLSNSYGCPKEPSSSKWYLVFNDLCKTAFTSNEIVLKTNGQALRDFIYMKDVCKVVEEIIGSNIQDEIFNLGADQAYSLLQVAQYVQQAFKEYTNLEIPVHFNKADQTLYPQVLEFKVDKLQKSIPFEPENAFVQEAKKIFRLLTANS
jgi:UDP-glucose 4-epimerase